jgi:hypothetical protein
MASLSGAVDWAGFGGRGTGIAVLLGALHDVGQLFDRAQIGRCRFVDQLGDHQIALGDPRRPSSVTMTFSSRAWAIKVARFFGPFGRPLGLPERPFWNPWWRGGLP